MMQRTANENAPCLRRICKRSDQPKIERIVHNDARLILRGKRQRHDRVQTESQIATVDSCFDLVGSLQHGVAALHHCLLVYLPFSELKITNILKSSGWGLEQSELPWEPNFYSRRCFL